MIRKRRTKFTTILMSLCLMAGITLTIPGMSTKVRADPQVPTPPQFATKEDLLNSFDLDSNTDKSVAKVLFGQNGSGKTQEWYIAGKDPRSTNQNGLVLFAASPLKTGQKFDGNDYSDKKPYNNEWGCTYESTPPESVYVGHYGGSELRTVLKGLEKDLTYFSESEQNKMLPTIIKTTDALNRRFYTTLDKLYTASVLLSWTDSTTITVGAEGSGGTIEGALQIHLSNLSGDSEFWLRELGSAGPRNVLTAQPDSTINNGGKMVDYEFAVQPAFELNLESLLFASTVPVATTERALTAGEAFTLRYDAGTSLGTASINPSQTNVAVKSVPSGTYLMVQNSTGAWAKPVNGDTDIPASQVTIGGTALSSFEGCKVWLETTDKGRITKAAAAAQETASVSIKAGKNMTLNSGNETQTGIIGKMTEVVYLANPGYYFPENYQVAPVSGIQVTRINASQIKVGGSPETKNVNITLSDSEEKGTPEAPSVTGGVEKITGTTSDMEYANSDIATTWTTCTDKETPVEAGTWYVRFKETDTKLASPAAKVEVEEATYTIEASPRSLTFDPVNEGYTQAPDAKTVTIKNTGNSPVTLNQPGTMEGKFIIGELSPKNLNPGDKATFTIQPVTEKTKGNYFEHLSIATAQGTQAKISASYTVNESFSAAIAPDNAQIIEGQSQTLTAMPTGGSGTYTYTWYAGTDQNVISTEKQMRVSPTTTTTYKVIVADTIEYKEAAATVTVTPAIHTIEASPKEGLTFDTVDEGYTQPDAKTITIKNVGNSPVTLNQPTSKSGNYTIGALSKTNLDAGGTAAFTVQPVTKLTGGTYNETIEVTTAQNTKAAIDISFKVNKAPAEAPKITKGANGVWTKGSKDGLTFRSDSPFEEFKYVLVDNKKTAASNYTVKPGSTIVTLKPEYLETLSEGKHTIAIVSENGTAETTFTIAKKGTAVPETGDNNSLYLLLAMLLLSGAGLITITFRSKSNRY